MAKILTTEEMAVYLKQAMELEASVYTQDRALTESKRTLEKSTPNKKKVFQSTVREPKEPQTSPVNIDGMVKGHRTSMVLGSILLVLGLIFVIIAWSDYHHGGLIAPGLIMVIIGILFLLSQKNYKTRLGNAEAQKIKNDELIASYNKEKAEYPAKKAESERKYKADLQEAETSFQEATHRHEIATAAADQL
ncbi:MAG: hypothetical protein IJ072_04030, partial [Oscillospiraceae bacterium]|nr:hypothetical protein [Oscillospiraceae bacterium]